MDSLPYKKAHFIGIGGVGMSATAKLLKDAGVEVTGSDEAVYPPISTFLTAAGLTYKTPYDPANIPPDADLTIIGKNAKLIPETNTEVAAALASGKKICSFPDVLAELSASKEAVVVAGSYGKSTSTSLLAHCLVRNGKDPSYFIGAIPVGMPNAKMGSGPLFVLEGDEYPSSNIDLRSKFLLMHPKHLLLTPLAHDHFNAFPTPAAYLKPFYELMALVPQNGTAVVCTEGPLSGEFLANIARPVVTYGLAKGEFTASDIAWGEKTRFNILQNNKMIVRIETSQLGEHSIQNIVGVAAFVFSKNLMTAEEFARGVTSFRGVVRRLDRKSEKTSIPIFEGFGSSYEKMKSAVAAMKKHFPHKRLLVVFEPNTIGWRSRATLSQYDDVFAGAAGVLIFNPPHDGKETQLSSDEIAEQVTAHGTPASAVEIPEQVLEILKSDLRQDDAILLSSSGAMGGLIESIPKLAEEKFPA